MKKKKKKKDVIINIGSSDINADWIKSANERVTEHDRRIHRDIARRLKLGKHNV